MPNLVLVGPLFPARESLFGELRLHIFGNSTLSCIRDSWFGRRLRRLWGRLDVVFVS